MGELATQQYNTYVQCASGVRVDDVNKRMGGAGPSSLGVGGASYSAIEAVVEGGSSTSSAGADVWCGQDGVAVTQL